MYYRWLLGNSLAHVEEASLGAAAGGGGAAAAGGGGAGGGGAAAEGGGKLKEARLVLGEVRMSVWGFGFGV